MNTRTIIAKGGPAHGKRYTAPHGLERVAGEGGSYRITDKQAIWEPTPTASATPKPKAAPKAAPKAKPKATPTAAPAPTEPAPAP